MGGQKTKSGSFLKNYSDILLLLSGIIAGSILGLVFGKGVEVIKPLGDIFLNMLFTAIIPLIFFTIATSIATLEKTEKLENLRMLENGMNVYMAVVNEVGISIDTPEDFEMAEEYLKSIID